MPERRALLSIATALFLLAPDTLLAQVAHYPSDRGTGIPTSMFGTYIQPGESLIYPFYEFTNQNLEYKLCDLGYGLEQDFRGRFREHEAMLFLGYGVNDHLAVELESALYTVATLQEDPADPSAVPSRIRESGLGDTQGEVRWRWAKETASRPEIFSFLEGDFPLQRNRTIIGTHDWEYKLGTGAMKAFSFGTITVRGGLEYSGVEGTEDEVEWVVEWQCRLGQHAILKLNSAFGVTSKAPRWAPEVECCSRFESPAPF